MMLEPEKLQNRGKQGWPNAGKGTVECLRREAETPEARQERLQHHRAAESLSREAETPEARQQRLQYKFLHALRGCSRSLPRCATGNGLQTTSLATCSGSPHNARIH